MPLKWSRPAVTLMVHIILKGSSQKTFLLTLSHMVQTQPLAEGKQRSIQTILIPAPNLVQPSWACYQLKAYITKSCSLRTLTKPEIKVYGGLSYDICNRKHLFSWHEKWIKHLLVHVCGGLLSVSLTTIHQYWHLLPKRLSLHHQKNNQYWNVKRRKHIVFSWQQKKNNVCGQIHLSHS